MEKLKMLVLTDHSDHSSENSLYPLVREMRLHPKCACIDVASRGNHENDLFFKRLISKTLFVTKVDEGFAYHPEGLSFKKQLRKEFLRSYDIIWLRLPPPLTTEFLNFLIESFPNQFFINDPAGIYETGSKAFLMNFQDLCPPMKICTSVADILEFKAQFPIVLKPFREYGGKGILKVEGDVVYDGNQKMSLDSFVESLSGNPVEYLGVKYLKNVSEGDKRIIVVKGQIMGATLRLPAKDSWLCNVSQGGIAESSETSAEEFKIVERIDPLLSKMGIVMYGVDTLVGDDGKRILSEINTTSIGGLPQMAKFAGKPLVKIGTHLIWDYIIEKIYGKTPV